MCIMDGLMNDQLVTNEAISLRSGYIDLFSMCEQLCGANLKPIEPPLIGISARLWTEPDN